jgi:MFS family permease
VDKQEKRIMRLTTLSHGLVHLYEGVLPPLIPLVMAQFSTDYFHLGLIVSIFSYAFGFGSLPAGYLADKLGPRRLVVAYLFGAGISAVCIWPLKSLLTYGAVMGFIGMFCSTYHPASNTLLSHSIREKGVAFGIHGITGSLGVAVVPVVSAWIGTRFGWKTPHVFFGFLGIALGFYSLSVPKHELPSADEESGEESRANPRSISYLNVIFFYLSAVALGLSYRGIMTFLPAFMGENVHFGFLKLDAVAIGGAVATVVLLSGAVGQYTAGLLLKRRRAEKLYVAAVVLATLFVFCMASGSGLFLVIAAVLYAFFYFATQPIQNYLISKYLPKNRQGLGFGIHFFLTFGIGSTAAAVSGYLADNFGLAYVFYAMGVCFVVSSFLAAALMIRVNTGQTGLRHIEPLG